MLHSCIALAVSIVYFHLVTWHCRVLYIHIITISRVNELSRTLFLWKEFGGNVDKDIERVHYFNSPFVARFIRFHPLDWNRHISMRAGLYGCPYTGTVPIQLFWSIDRNLTCGHDWCSSRRYRALVLTVACSLCMCGRAVGGLCESSRRRVLSTFFQRHIYHHSFRYSRGALSWKLYAWFYYKRCV